MGNNERIKVGYLISYDYKYLEYALPTIYDAADAIALAIDKDRLTWNGQPINIPDTFFEWVADFDKQGKIKLYEDSFYVPYLTSMECETRERNLLAGFLGEGGWHIQLDLDEYFLNFEKFVQYLKSLNFAQKYDISAEWITIFKQKESEFYLIDANEKFPLASNRPQYTLARNLDDVDRKKIKTDFKVLHHSWGRSSEELQQKLSNWGHNEDFNTQSYFNLWNIIDKNTYKYLRDFHPLDNTSWKELEYVEAATIPLLIEKVEELQIEKMQCENSNKSFFSRVFSKKKR